MAGTFLRVHCMDFSVVFYSIQPHILLSRPLDLDGSLTSLLLVHSFRCDRPQKVTAEVDFSNELVLNTGVSQRCTLSPALLSLYTNELTCLYTTLMLITFADHMALVATLKHEPSLSQYFMYIDTFVSWFDHGLLEPNVQETFVCWLVGCLTSNMRVHLRDGSAQTIVRAATLR